MTANQLEVQDSSHTKKIPKWLFILLILTASIVSLAGFAAFFWFFNFSGKTLPVTAKDREVLLDIYKLSEWMEGFSPKKNSEHISKKKYWDRSYEIEYEYEEPDNDNAPYLRCTISLERNRPDTVLAYKILWGATKLGFSLQSDTDISVFENNQLFKWGDASRFGLIMLDKAAVGNVFVARKRFKVLYLIFSGVYFEDKEAITELLSPVLLQFEKYHP